MNLIEAMNDPALFGPWFGAESWRAWRAILKAAFALPLDPTERDFFRTVAGREPPDSPVKELWVIAGRRAGKDSVASVIACWFAALAALTGVLNRLRPGERAVVMCLAVDREQARIVLEYIRGYFREVPMLRAMLSAETKDGLQLDNGVDIAVHTNDYRQVRGRSILCCVMDEVSFWRSETSAAPDEETYRAVKPGMATLPDSLLVGITTPHRKSGLAFQKWKRHYGQHGDTLVIRAPSRALNPTLDQRIIDDAVAEDPQAARAEWLAEWRDDISGFLPREAIEACTDSGVLVRPPQLHGPYRNVAYRAFCDPSGGVGDSFTAAIAHAERGNAILDCLVEVSAPFNPSSATKHISDVLKSYGVRAVIGDRYAARWVIEAFAQNGVRYQQARQDRSAIYLEALPLFTSGRARLLDNPKLATQFASLERRTFASGRDRIDHPLRGHDDLSNSAAGALVQAVRTPRLVRVSGWYSRWSTSSPSPEQIARQIRLMTRH